MEDSSLEYLSQLKKVKKSATFNQIVDRMIAENDLRRYFDELRGQGFKVHENVDTAIDFDFSIRKEDFEVIGLIEYTASTNFNISRDKVKELNRILTSTIRAEAILLVWAVKPQYPSVFLNFNQLNQMLAEQKNAYDLSAFRAPIRDLTEKVFKKPEKYITSSEALGAKYKQAERIRVEEVFNRFLYEETGTSKLKKYKLDYRGKAAQSLKVQDVALISKLFKIALEKKIEKTDFLRWIEEIEKVN